MKLANGFESICLKPQTESPKSDINHNGEVKQEDVDSDTECTEPSETTTVCVKTPPKSAESGYERSVETSTETLVSENVLCG